MQPGTALEPGHPRMASEHVVDILRHSRHTNYLKQDPTNSGESVNLRPAASTW